MKEILLNKGFIALVDDEDYDYLNQWHWTAVKDNYTYYARRGQWIEGKKKHFLMHRVLMEKYSDISGKLIDHKDHSGLNNQKCNLRVSGNGGNSFNKLKSTRTHLKKSSQYKGVSKIKKSGLYKAIIIKNYKQVYISEFENEIDAAIAYDLYAKQLFGEFAHLNFNDTTPEEECRIKELIEKQRKKFTSELKGVRLVRKTGKWNALYSKKKKQIHLGTFLTEKEAAIAYQNFINTYEQTANN